MQHFSPTDLLLEPPSSQAVHHPRKVQDPAAIGYSLEKLECSITHPTALGLCKGKPEKKLKIITKQ